MSNQGDGKPYVRGPEATKFSGCLVGTGAAPATAARARGEQLIT